MPATSQPQPSDRRGRRRTYRLVAASAVLATAGALAAALPADAHEAKHSKPRPSRYQDVQLLSFNDLHGNLEPPSGSSGRVTDLQADGTLRVVREPRGWVPRGPGGEMHSTEVFRRAP